jgi:hypothetical protein
LPGACSLNVAEPALSIIVFPVAPSQNAFIARILAIAMAVTTGGRAALWVSADGDDQNPGTEERPLRTIGRARDIARTLNRDMTDDITVFVGGSHHVARPIEFGPEDSGTNGYNIVYTAAPGEHPVISGGVRVEGWTIADSARNLWSAPAPEGLANTHDLFVNGTPAGRTRGRLPQVFAKSTAGAAAPAPDPGAQWKNPGDVVFESPGPGAIWSERTGAPPFFVQNAFELLGAPGEWYFDRPARRIYYTPRAGEDMAAADVEAAAAESLVAGNGTRDRPLSGLIFKGIRFEYTTCLSSPEGASKAPPSPGGPPAAVRFAFAVDIQFLEDEFLHLGTPALELGPGLAGGTVEGCVFGDISWAAIRIAGASRVRIAESRLSYIATEHDMEGAIDVDHSEDVVIEHVDVDNFPRVGILESGEGAGAVREASNLIAPPMIGFHGVSPAVGCSETPTGDAGVSPYYNAVLDEKFSAPTIPRPPSTVSAEVGDGFAYVTWIPSCLDGGSPVTSYTVTSSTGEKTTVSAADFQARGYVIVTGLENGRGASFTVAASSAFGASPPSLPSATVVPAHKKKLKPPSPPAAASVTFSTGGARIEITPPAENGGSPVVSYTVTSAPSGARVVLEGMDVIHSDPTHPLIRTIAGFTRGPGATVLVAARNAAGEGKPAVANPRP